MAAVYSQYGQRRTATVLTTSKRPRLFLRYRLGSEYGYERLPGASRWHGRRAG